MKNQKLLENWFNDKDGVLVAFSGGVDSSVVAKAAFISLREKAIAATAVSPTYPKVELNNAKKVAEEIGIKHILFEEDEFENPKFIENPPDRCYHCRKSLIKGLKTIKEAEGVSIIVDGANNDDIKQHRPGMRAMRENGVRSPLLELGLGKTAVRDLARAYGLSVADKPSMACLASRIPYGEIITKDKLLKIAKAENYLHELGFRQFRVRNHYGIARIEVFHQDIMKAVEYREVIIDKFRALGFKYIALDLEGYRPGSMDEVL
jgi:uncharacterized protein